MNSVVLQLFWPEFAGSNENSPTTRGQRASDVGLQIISNNDHIFRSNVHALTCQMKKIARRFSDQVGSPLRGVLQGGHDRAYVQAQAVAASEITVPGQGDKNDFFIEEEAKATIERFIVKLLPDVADQDCLG